MKTVQMTLDEQLVKAVDSARKEVGNHTIRLYPGSLAFRTQGSSRQRIGVATPRRIQT